MSEYVCADLLEIMESLKCQTGLVEPLAGAPCGHAGAPCGQLSLLLGLLVGSCKRNTSVCSHYRGSNVSHRHYSPLSNQRIVMSIKNIFGGQVESILAWLISWGGGACPTTPHEVCALYTLTLCCFEELQHQKEINLTHTVFLEIA